VFITAFKEYALEGYRVNAFDYLLKPVSYDEFLTTFRKAQEWFAAIAKNNSGHQSPLQTDAVFVKSEHRLIPVFFKDILYIEGLKDYIKIYTLHQDRPIITLESMKNMETLLPDMLFLRVHRSFIVRKDKIQTVNRNRLTVANREIPIGRTYKQEVLHYIDSLS
ncbi:MAG TPA: DNA-binding response regulator, partial [Porphyromonadaceae bacterium]|nr:DNA-binding response regulator [Porphyromonadaceae bacterium]